MALSRIKTWSDAEVLTAADLNGEFNNILNNALTLISPLTGPLNVDGQDLTSVDEVAFADAMAGATAAGRLRRNGANITWHDGTNALNLVTSTGTTNSIAKFSGAGLVSSSISDSGTLITITNPVLLASYPGGTPSTNAAYHQSVAKGWVVFDGTVATPSVAAHLNVSSITDNGTGDYTVSWDQDFSTSSYLTVFGIERPAGQGNWAIGVADTSSSKVVGSVRVRTTAGGALTDNANVNILSMGSQ
jgi:hypothetical protein